MQRVLRRAVHRTPGQADPGPDGLDVDHGSGTFLAHLRKHQCGKFDGSPNVHSEHTLGEVKGGLRYTSVQSDARIIDEDVNGSELRSRGRDSLAAGRVIGHVPDGP